jgi:hypothetical protein
VKDQFYSYTIDALSFLERAEAQLKRFDLEDDISCLLYAALELRIGIECRLYETINSYPEEEKKNHSFHRETAATKLLKKLNDIDYSSNETQSYTIAFKKHETVLTYTPVSKKLASFHGRLGDFLHFPLFENTSEWYVKDPSGSGDKETLGYYRKFLNEVKEELRLCCSGDLLRPVNVKNA